MRSSYQLGKLSVRDRWPDGTLLAPGQYGPRVNAEFPLGMTLVFQRSGDPNCGNQVVFPELGLTRDVPGVKR
jgi:hypothetical protein